MEIVRVRAADPTMPVAAWEKNPAHPGGMAHIRGEEVFEVALTPYVQRRLRKGILLLAEDEPPARKRSGWRKRKKEVEEMEVDNGNTRPGT